jgi:O-antigen biosynthesis protein
MQEIVSRRKTGDEARAEQAPCKRLISFITATHNGLAETQGMLRSFQRTVSCENFEYIFIDDASRDGSRDFLSQLRSPYRLLVNERSLGFASANNRGAREARGDFLVFLNNDLIFDTPWLAQLIEPLSRRDVGAVGNVQFNPATGLIDHAGMFIDRDGMPRRARRNTRRIPDEPYREWNCLSAACLAIRREIFWELGGFDEAFRNGCEDIDLCLRLRQKGYRLLVANRSRIGHIGGHSPERHKHNAENEELFRLRWQKIAREWAKDEWAREYLLRYSRQWWKLRPAKAALALWTLCLSRPHVVEG